MKYLPLVIAAGVLLGVVLHGWISRDQESPTTLLTLTVVLVLAPLAARINVFGIFDFQKTVDRLDSEISETKNEVTTISHSIQSLQQSLKLSATSNSRQDQVFSFNFQEPAAVEAIKEQIKIETEEELEH